MGGMAIAALGQLYDVVLEVGCDETGSGQWSWLKIGSGDKITYVIVAYLPEWPEKTSHGNTV